MSDIKQDQEVVIAKIRKLLALGTSPNEAEASAAMAKAHELLVRHNMEMSEVESKDEIEFNDEELFEGSRFQPKWKQHLGVIVGKHFLVVFYQTSSRLAHGKRNHVVGKKVNVLMFKQAMEYLEATYSRLSEAFMETWSAEHVRPEGTTQASWTYRRSQIRDSYCRGLNTTFSKSLQEQERRNTERGLVATHGVDMSRFRQGRARQSAVDHTAFGAGVRDGHEVKLRGAISHERSTGGVLAIG